MRNPFSLPRCPGFVPMLVLGMSVAGFIPPAMSQTGPLPELWSIQLHGGLYLPEDMDAAGSMAGMRYSKHFNSHVSGGVLTGGTLIRETLNASDGSIGYTPEVELARVDAKLFPVMGFLQVDLTDRFFLVPYLGVGAGYVGRGLRSERRQRRAAGQAPRQAPEPASGRDGRLTAVRRAGRASEQRAESTSGRRAVVPATVDNDKPGERL